MPMPASAPVWLDAEVPLPAQLMLGCTTRYGGESEGAYAFTNLADHVGDDPAAVTANRNLLSRRLGGAELQWLQQVHSSDCVYSSAATRAEPPRADAVWTDQAGVGLAILTADCVPVLLWSADGARLGAAHAGWRGLRDGVLDELVRQMSDGAAGLAAWIGPCIGVDHYEVGEDVWRQFAELDSECIQAHASDADKRMLDLALIAERALHRLGVDAVYQSRWCTYADERFYSFRGRQQAETGRIASVIMRVG